YQFARRIAKECAPVITVHQAGGAAAGELYPRDDMLEGCKCLAPGTEIAMHNAPNKKVEDVVIGDLLMGPDGAPRKVLSTTQGEAPMFRVAHRNGDYYDVTHNHTLTLQKRTNRTTLYAPSNYGDVVDIPLDTFLRYKKARPTFLGFWGTTEYMHREVPVDPYIMGLWLADGSSSKPEFSTMDAEISTAVKRWAGDSYRDHHDDNRCCYPRVSSGKPGRPNWFLNQLRELGVCGNKHIPELYLYNSTSIRRELLAGYIDGNGSLSIRPRNTYFDVCCRQRVLAEQLHQLAKSVGLYSSMRMYKSGLHRLYMCGALGDIPTKIRRKQSTFTAMRPRTSSLKVTPLGRGTYHGFSLDGDGRLVLGNLIVTHNTEIQGELDVQIMMGRTDGPGREHTRGLNIVKNKLASPGDENYRHAQWEVTIRPDIARFESAEA
ncbi:MAG: Hint domain-containing homing endonuclease, partial [Nitrososphaera sp.]